MRARLNSSAANRGFSALLLVLSVVVFVVRCDFARAQQTELGPAVYDRASQAVFLVEVRATSGDLAGVASAFYIGNSQLITNAHVTAAGKPFLRIGPVAIPCTVEAADQVNDLAVLRAGMQLDATPLALAETAPPIGAEVFVIGNPSGLERTLSQGIISGKRTEEGRQLLQLTAPISHGSSGGPVLTTSGAVVGVAVGYLQNGQNLNFAVPAAAVSNLLRRREHGDGETLADLLAQLNERIAARSQTDYSDDPGSDWVKLDQQVTQLFRRASKAAAGSDDDLLKIAQLAHEHGETDVSVEVATGLIAGRRNPTAELLLAEALQTRSLFENGSQQASTLATAKRHALNVVESTKRPSARQLFVLGTILEDSDDGASAYSRFGQALEAAKAAGDRELGMYHAALFRTSRDLGKDSEAVSWFRLMESRGEANAYRWRDFARFLDNRKRYAEGGEAWRRTAQLSGSFRDWCEAGGSFRSGDQLDAALASYRTCLQKGANQSGAEKQLGDAHADMAFIFVERGVYEQAIVEAREAIALVPEDGWAYYQLARAQSNLQRHSEAVQSALAAIRLTDGRYAVMHFQLGASYFDLKQWEKAEIAFEKSAEMRPDDSASTYNIALCLAKLGMYSDAARWFEETLRRQPNHPEKADIQRRIAALRR